MKTKNFFCFKKPNLYGVMALLSFLLLSLIIYLNKNKDPFQKISNIQEWLGTYTIIYVLFSKLFFLLFDKKEKITLHNFFNFHDGGLSSFGGQTGVVLTFLYHSYNYNISIIYIIESIVLLIPILGVCVRTGNILNRRIKPRFSNHSILKHNLEIELFFHGFVFGGIVWYKYIYNYKVGCLINAWFKYYSSIRFITEFLREKQKYYNLNYNNLIIGIWQVFCLININPYNILFIIDQYCKQHCKQYSYTKNFNMLNKYTIVWLLFILYYVDNYLIILGLFSYLIDIICFGRIRNYIYLIGNFGNIYILLGIIFFTLNLNIGNTAFYYNYY